MFLRFSADGEYRSPNICFISADDEDNIDDDQVGGDETDEGADPGDGDESDGNGDEADAEDAGDPDAEYDDGEKNTGDVDSPARETPKRKTANDVIREQKRTRKEASARAEAAERKAEAAELKAAEALRRAEIAEQRANERRAAETAEQEAARLELMTESEKSAHFRQKDKDEYTKEVNGLKLQMWDSNDRAAFRDLMRDEPAIAKVKDQVEAEFAKQSAQGRPVPREILANQLIAKQYREAYGKKVTQTRTRTEERTRRETVKPARTRSDVTPNRTRRGQEDSREARRKRLEEVQL